MWFARWAARRSITIDAAVAGAFFVATLVGALAEGTRSGPPQVSEAPPGQVQ